MLIHYLIHIIIVGILDFKFVARILTYQTTKKYLVFTILIPTSHYVALSINNITSVSHNKLQSVVSFYLIKCYNCAVLKTPVQGIQ